MECPDSDAVVVNSQRSANLGAGRLHNLAQEPIKSSSLLLAIILNLPLHQMMMQVTHLNRANVPDFVEVGEASIAVEWAAGHSAAQMVQPGGCSMGSGQKNDHTHSHGKNELARLSAAEIILSRGWGKPVQPHEGENGEPIRYIIAWKGVRGSEMYCRLRYRSIASRSISGRTGKAWSSAPSSEQK